MKTYIFDPYIFLRRVAQKTEKDKKLKKKIVRLEKQINLSRMNGLLPKSIFCERKLR